MTKTFLLDAVERVAASFAEAVIAAILSGALAAGLNASTGHVLLVAGLTAAVATVKTLVASVLPTKGASLVPHEPTPRKRPAKKV